MPVPAILGALAIAQGGLGIGQMIGGSSQRKRAEREFDEFTVPNEMNTMLDIAHGMSSQTDIPGTDVYRSRAMGKMSQGIEAAERVGTPTDVLGAATGMFSDYLDTEQNLSVKGAEMQRESQMNEMNVLRQIGDYQTQAWQYNELQPYMQRMNAAGQMSQAGGQNINSALGAGMNIGMANWDLNQQDQQFGQWMDRRFPKGDDTSMWNSGAGQY